MSIAFLGPAGTFTESALRQIEPDPAHHLPVASVPAALAAVRDGRAASAVVPIENSVEGGVSGTLDVLAATDSITIVAEQTVQITFVLAAREQTALEQLTTVSSHPHAQAQVQGWLRSNVPGANNAAASSTAAAARDLAAGDVEYQAAICPALAAERYGLEVLAEDIGDGDVELAAGTIALGLCFGAYATEVFRGALLAIPKGHREAGLALGLGKRRIFLRLILPQMWRLALPGLGNLFMILMKDTALVSVIGLEEIMRRSQIAVTASKEPFTFFLVAAFIYLCLTIVAMIGMHFLEKRAGRGFVRSAA